MECDFPKTRRDRNGSCLTPPLVRARARVLASGYVHTGRSAIALAGAVSMLVLPHAVTAGASLYIEQGKLNRIREKQKLGMT